MLIKLNRWFELNLGWMFVNGRKEEIHLRYLRKKYGKDSGYNPGDMGGDETADSKE